MHLLGMAGYNRVDRGGSKENLLGLNYSSLILTP